MARTLDVADRVILLLSLIPYLREHGPTSVQELAQVFETNEQTIRKLVIFLGTAGIPGETHTYQPEDLFDIDWEAFEQDDVVSLTQLVAVDDTPRFSAAEYAALLAGLHTLQAVLPPETQAIAASAAAKLAQAAPHTAPDVTSAALTSAPFISAPFTVSADPSDPQVAVITGAIEQRHRLTFHYQDLRGTQSVRNVEPFSLTQSGYDWYLRGFCLDRQAERTFLLASMRDTLDTTELSDHVGTGTYSVLGPETAALHTSIRVRTHALHAIAGFTPTVIAESAPGWLRAEVLLEHPAAAIRLIQAAPGDVCIDAPEGARAAVSEWATRALAPYDQ